MVVVCRRTALAEVHLAATRAGPRLDRVVDPTLRRVLAKALAVHPAERYQTADEFLSALEPFLAGQSAMVARPFAGGGARFSPLTQRIARHFTIR